QPWIIGELHDLVTGPAVEHRGHDDRVLLPALVLVDGVGFDVLDQRVGGFVGLTAKRSGYPDLMGRDIRTDPRESFVQNDIALALVAPAVRRGIVVALSHVITRA